MKGILFISLFFYTFSSLVAQPAADELVQIHSVTATQMNAITSPLTGSLVFNADDMHFYGFDGTNWVRLHIIKPIKAVTTNYTLTAADNGAAITVDSAIDVILTIPAGLPIGYNVSVYQTGNGQITIQGESGVTISNRLSRFRTAGQNAGVGIFSTNTNVFHLTGDLKR